MAARKLLHLHHHAPPIIANTAAAKTGSTSAWCAVRRIFMSGVFVRQELFKYTCDAINLNEEALTDELVGNLLDAIRTGKFSRLTRLHLENNMITDKGGVVLAQCIRSNCSLKWLYLGNNRIGDETAVAVADALRANCCLQWIDLSGNSITETGARALSRALCLNTCLQELYLHQNSIGDSGAAALAEVLEANATLRRLGLGNNQISDLGASSLAVAISRNSTLQQLWLDDNAITDHGAQQFAHSLQYNSSMEWLDIDGSVSAPVMKTINAFIRRNAREPLRAAAEVLDMRSLPFICTIYHSHRRLALAFSDAPPALPARLYAPPGPHVRLDSSGTSALLSHKQRLQLLCMAGSSEYRPTPTQVSCVLMKLHQVHASPSFFRRISSAVPDGLHQQSCTQSASCCLYYCNILCMFSKRNAFSTYSIAWRVQQQSKDLFAPSRAQRCSNT
jgi:hypothetical protein